MSEERKRRSLTDTLRATSPIAGDALAGAASAMRRISAPADNLKAAQATFSPVLNRTPDEAAAETAKAEAAGKPYPVALDGHALPGKPRRKGKPLTRPVSEPLSQPLSQPVSRPLTRPVSKPVKRCGPAHGKPARSPAASHRDAALHRPLCPARASRRTWGSHDSHHIAASRGPGLHQVCACP